MHKQFQPTNDAIIRASILSSLKDEIERDHIVYPNYRLIEEFSVAHGAARIDIAVINGFLHGYELKSDLDTLNRLPAQMKEYNAVMDKVTLVVGKSHLHEAIYMIPDWWGIMVAKIIEQEDRVVLFRLREPRLNPNIDLQKVAALLWRCEAFDILEELQLAGGFRCKSRSAIYHQLASNVQADVLKQRIRDALCARLTC